MNFIRLSMLPVLLLLLAFSFSTKAQAQESAKQFINLKPGWNIVSTPKVLESHSFSVPETAGNFDIYLLDASQPSGWATMSALGQSTFTPLYGYFINNKTGSEQTLTFNYDTALEPNEKLFERTFSSSGWYSIGVANDEYAKKQADDSSDTDNPSTILSLLEGEYDLTIDFTDAEYDNDRRSVVVSDPWKAAAPVDINNLNDLRETKGYAIYIKNPGAKYSGFQNDATAPTQGEATITLNPENRTVALGQQFDMTLVVNSESISINGVEATLNFDSTALSVVEVSRNNSDFSLWTTEPNFSNDNGTIEFGGGSPTPFTGYADVIQITFQALQTGTTTVIYSGVRIIAADGLGTNIAQSSPPSTIIVGSEDVGDSDELVVKSSNRDFDSYTIGVDSDRTSDNYPVFIWQLDASDSPNNITVHNVVVTVELSSSTYEAIVDDATLVVNDLRFNDIVVNNGDSSIATLDFDTDGLLSVGAGEIKEAELWLRFNALELGNEGATVQAITQAANYSAEGIDDLALSQLFGSAAGDTHTLRTQGIEVFPGSTSAVMTSVDGDGNDYATFEIEVEITAFEQDVYISTNPDVSIDFSLQDGAGSPVPIGQQTAVLTSSADEVGSYFEIPEGQTETLSLQVTYQPGTTQSARLRLNSISFNDVASAPDQVQTTLPQTDYRTSIVTIVN